jgi:hypothetical protein
MQNPDFPAIKASGFNDFIGVPFFQSYNQYYGYTHNIKNIGEDILYTNFWINEFYKPDDADTFFEVV